MSDNLKNDILNATLSHETEEPSSFSLMGWICPVCGRGLSPYTDSCPCVVNWEITCGTGTAVPQHGEVISHIHQVYPDNVSANTYSNTNEIGYIKNANIYQKRMGRDEI